MEEIKLNWKTIWARKGNEETLDLCVLNGHENTNFCSSAPLVVEKIRSALGAKDSHNILEIGCGAGMLAQFFNCSYTGVDYSESLIKKHRDILGNTVFVAEASKLPFGDNSFDHAFSYSVFHYFSDKEYAQKAIAEMERVAKEVIFIGDLPIDSCRSDDHLLFSVDEFDGWKISDSYYNRPDGTKRFNVCKTLK